MLILYHDYISPASAIAALRLQRLADDGVAVTFTGFEALGVDLRLPVTLEVLAAVDELAEAAAAEGLVLRRPPALPPTAWAHVVGALAEKRGLGASWREVCYRAFWEEGVNLADPAVLTGLAVRAGLDVAAVDAHLRDPSRLRAFRRSLAESRRLGVGGVPVLLAHGTLVPALLPEADLRGLAD
ncbi:MAG TPA: DsbA family protein [Egibacteraceae bacterium]|jgi:2-hydroxychromene-2-carboxylate isomerase|nr:DsbA family protein [Egibacteraceae bacterium]